MHQTVMCRILLYFPSDIYRWEAKASFFRYANEGEDSVVFLFVGSPYDKTASILLAFYSDGLDHQKTPFKKVLVLWTEFLYKVSQDLTDHTTILKTAKWRTTNDVATTTKG